MSAILGTAAILIRGDTKGLGGDFGKAKGIITSALGGLGSLAAGPLALLTGGLAAAGIGALSFGAAMATAIGTIAEGIEMFKEASALNTRMEAVLKATGGAAGFTADQLRAMADEIQNTTVHEGDSVLGLQAKLMAFDKVSGDVFKRALTGALDLADSGFGSAEANVAKLGKVLSDPTKGLDKLRMMGIKFTDAEKKKIKALVEGGQLLKAQGMILDRLEGKYGGVSKALGKTDAGRNSILKNILGDAKERLGEVFLPIVNKVLEVKIAITNAFASAMEAIGPYLQKGVDFVSEFIMDSIEWFQAGVENFRAIWAIAPQIMKAIVMTILDYWLFFREALPQYIGFGLKIAFDLWLKWMSLMGKAVAQLILGIGEAFMALPGIIADALSGKGTGGVGEAMEKIIDFALAPVRGMFKGMKGELPDWSKAISDETKAEWGDIGDALGAVAKRKKELEDMRAGKGAAPIVGKGGAGGVGGKIEEEITINWDKVTPKGFVGFEALGRTIQENLLKEDAKKVAERTAKAAEGALVKFDSMDKHLMEISKKTGEGSGFLSDDSDGGPL